uniref:Uncharacterized protein n=1 Tax=Anopheles maculatus TaxID=74869 RepID=A0A182S7X5_9DIPT
MDLVDIDKVLDDLELNEDDGTSTATRASDTKSSVRESGVSVNGGTTTEQTAAVGPATVSGHEKIKFKANVVNVSTVFSSLNEYVNAGGTELSGAKHVTLHDSHDLGIPSERKPLLTPPSNSSISSDVKTSSAAATSSSVPTSPQHVVSSPTTSPDSSASSVSCCSSRVDASSSASSSAHSSSRSSSSSASSSASSSDAEDADKRDATGERALGHVHEKLPEELSSLSADDYVLDTSSMTTLATTNEGAARKGATTADAQDTSAFSYKNSLYSDTLSNDVINLEGISSISSIVAVDLTKSAREANGLVEGGAPVAKDEIETTAQDDVERPAKQPEADDARKPAVGFESTMDDVSDTELESYLQELEEFDFRSVNVESTVPPKPDTESVTIPDTAVETQPDVDRVAVEMESSAPIVKDRADENSIDSRSDDEISPSSSRGDNEDDLISQASTLEFNDLAMGATAAVAATTPLPPA